MKNLITLCTVVLVVTIAGLAVPALASSHMDAPLITLDPAANTTDVYAFRSQQEGVDYLTVALAVYPFEEPGVGPNKYNFDDNVLYEIHVALDKDVAAGRASISYQFRFKTRYKNTKTILQSYLDVIQDVDDDGQNLTQTYTVTKIDRRGKRSSQLVLGRDLLVPPNNQGIVTPKYNQGDNGNNPAKNGVGTSTNLDHYTAQTVYDMQQGYRVFAGQRDDGFYGDISSIFDLLQGRNPGKDSQAGFNVHTIVLNIPFWEIGGGGQVVGVYATTSRQTLTVLRKNASPQLAGQFVQVGRQGNPLFCEAFIPIADKDLYNRTTPDRDSALFKKYVLAPELGALINKIAYGGSGPAVVSNRTDLTKIFIPDLIKVDLSTDPARLAGGPGNADDSGFSRLGFFGGDTLISTVQPGYTNFPAGTVSGGWPNGRRFGDDVVDIAIISVISDLRGFPPLINPSPGDNVIANDIGYNKVFPYAATPHNGRNHTHH
jgi:hypothetical protein